MKTLMALLLLCSAVVARAQSPVIENHQSQLEHLTILDTVAFGAITDAYDIFAAYAIRKAPPSTDTITDFYTGTFGRTTCHQTVKKAELHFDNLLIPYDSSYYAIAPGTNRFHATGIMNSYFGVEDPGDTIYIVDHRYENIHAEFTLDSIQDSIYVQGQNQWVDVLYDTHDINSILVNGDLYTVVIEEINFDYTLPNTQVINWEATQVAIYINGQRHTVNDQHWRACTPKMHVVTGIDYVAVHHNRISQLYYTGTGLDFALSFRQGNGISRYFYDLQLDSLYVTETIGALDTTYMDSTALDALSYLTWTDTARAPLYLHGADFITLGDTTYYATYNNRTGSFNDYASFDIIATHDSVAYLYRRIYTDYCSRRVGDAYVLTGSNNQPYFVFGRGYEGTCAFGFNPFAIQHDSVSADVPEVLIYNFDGDTVAYFNPPRFSNTLANTFNFVLPQDFDPVDVSIDTSLNSTTLFHPEAHFWLVGNDTTWGNTCSLPYPIGSLCDLDSVKGVYEATFMYHYLQDFEWQSTVGTPELMTPNLVGRFGPNPVKEFIQVELNAPCGVELRTLEGRLLSKQHLEKGSRQITTSGLAEGIYFCIISEEGSGRTVTKKIVLQD